MTHTEPETVTELLRLASAAAREAGAELLGRSADAHRVEEKTSHTDPVSEADRAAERLIVGRLHEARPDDGILAEEGSGRSGSTGLQWVIDPLDGTVNYLYGFPMWSVSIAVEDEHGGLVGVVYDPSADEEFSAVRGGGATLDGGQLRINEPVGLDMALVATGFGYSRDRRRRQAEVLATVLPAVRDIRRGGSAALDLCSVAAGRVDAYYEHGLSRWDWAAGAIVAREAGAEVTAVRDDRTGVEGIAAAGPSLLSDLRHLLDAATSSGT